MPKGPIRVETIRHTDASRRNIPTAELESVMHDDEKSPVRVAYERRNRDLDPQIVWRGKDAQDWSELVVNAPPLYIQEKVHPQALIDDLRRMAKAKKQQEAGAQVDLFADFNGLPNKEAATEFYQHDQHWSNRMILGDSLAVMASLAERESLRGKVQCIYFDPPYGIKFNSNFQWSTTSRDVKDGARDHVTREPEQVRAFRDTWKDGIHSYLTYLRDRLTVARDLLHESGSIFVQIGDENVHRVRALMDEVFGDENIVSLVTVQKAGSTFAEYIGGVADYLLWYCKDRKKLKFRSIYLTRPLSSDDAGRFTLIENEFGQRVGHKGALDGVSKSSIIAPDPLQSASAGREKGEGAASWFDVPIDGEVFRPTMQSRWKTNEAGMTRLRQASRIIRQQKSIRYARRFSDFSVSTITNIWSDLSGASDKIYVVQTASKIVERCILMTTDPGDLVLDPTCGSGTTAYVAEQWGRRWITIDTSRVSLALARSRLMGARYAYYLLADSPEGQRKEGEITRTAPRTTKTQGNVRHGFVYERVPHVTLKSIANNAEIDTIWEQRQPAVIAALAQLNATLAGHAAPFPVTQGGRAGHKLDFRAKGVMTLPSGEEAPKGALLEWEVPREAPESWPKAAHAALDAFWQARIARQKEIDASIAAKADFEYLYDKPYEDKGKVRVAGPFTVESLSPHRVLAMRDDEELIDVLEASEGKRKAAERDPKVKDFAEMVLENLGVAGVQQQDKKDRIRFTSLTGWPGQYICAEARYNEGEAERRAGIVIGPEFGTFARPALVAAAREAGDAGFDALVACAFNYDAHSSEFNRLGKVPVLKARMNPDLMMGNELKATGAGNLFVVFGEPDIKIHAEGDDQIRVQVFGVDVFKPQTGEVASEGTDGIALWMIDTDYNEESFFVRQCYFLGANDPYKALKTTLKAEIDEDAWTTLNSDMSRPFAKPASGRIAVKVINHLGDEVMKIFSV